MQLTYALPDCDQIQPLPKQIIWLKVYHAILWVTSISKILVEYKKNAWYSREKTTKYSVRKCTKDMESYFTKEDIFMASKYIKRCSTSLAIMEMQIKTTISLHVYQNNK